MNGTGTGSLSGLTEEEAKEIHSAFSAGFILFMLLALVVHILVWSIRPWGWLPESHRQVGSLDGSMDFVAAILPFMA